MKLRITLNFFAALAVFVIAAGNASAQTVAYRQTNLGSDVSVPGFANHTNLDLRNSSGIAFLPRRPFFVGNTNSGRVTSHDATGAPGTPGAFVISSLTSNGSGSPTGIVADPNSFFGGGDFVQPFLMATEDGGVYIWGLDANGDIPTAATVKIDHSRLGAIYTGLAILTPACCAPFLAVTNFHSGLMESYTDFFAPLAPPGSFTDPNLPVGYAPFGIQVIGNNVFVTYAVQDAAGQAPVFGAGNGIVSVFDLEGNFVRRFATGGNLNAPWGVTQASANFGPFSNDILIGNVGDGTINAFDLTTGTFVGQVKDGDGKAIVNSGLRALAFRSDGFGDSNTLFFTAGINNGQDGLFSALTPGLVSTASVSVSSARTDAPVPITISVAAGAGNPGTPTGQVAVQDNGVALAVVSLVNGEIVLPGFLTGAGTHVIEIRYEGDATFLPSNARTEVEVTGLATTLTLLAAPATAAPGAALTLTATANSAGGIPTGEVLFQEGSTSLGSAPLDVTGVATFRINTLAVGVHSVVASYGGDSKFGSASSAPVTIDIANPDFSLGAAPLAATVLAGQSTQFMLTVTPTGGFANSVTFSCSPVTGITCGFSPATVTPASRAAATTLTVTTSSTVSRYGTATLNQVGLVFLLAAVALFAFMVQRGSNLRRQRPLLLPAAAALAIFALSLTVGGCGGYGSGPQVNRGTASISIIAQSGNISHNTTVTVTVQ